MSDRFNGPPITQTEIPAQAGEVCLCCGREFRRGERGLMLGVLPAGALVCSRRCASGWHSARIAQAINSDDTRWAAEPRGQDIVATWSGAIESGRRLLDAVPGLRGPLDIWADGVPVAFAWWNPDQSGSGRPGWSFRRLLPDY